MRTRSKSSTALAASAETPATSHSAHTAMGQHCNLGPHLSCSASTMKLTIRGGSGCSSPLRPALDSRRRSLSSSASPSCSRRTFFEAGSSPRPAKVAHCGSVATARAWAANRAQVRAGACFLQQRGCYWAWHMACAVEPQCCAMTCAALGMQGSSLPLLLCNQLMWSSEVQRLPVECSVQL